MIKETLRARSITVAAVAFLAALGCANGDGSSVGTGGAGASGGSAGNGGNIGPGSGGSIAGAGGFVTGTGGGAIGRGGSGTGQAGAGGGGASGGGASGGGGPRTDGGAGGELATGGAAGRSGLGGSGTAGGIGSAGAPGSAGSGGAASACYPNQTHSHNLNNDNWAGTVTLFISYSSDTRSQTVDKGYTAAEWNAAVNSFDVPSFAAQVAKTGAKNILLMLGQNSGYYCSPNSVYETYAGVAPGTRCSTRDLPMELADALAAKGVGLYLYLPEDVGWGDTKAAKGFGLTSLAVGNWVVDASFTPKWNAVIKTWADRYGSKVKGWFFDGYEARWGVTATMANSYSATCKAANPCAVVTFNGTGSDSVSDTQRGETQIDTATGLPAKGLPTSRWDPKGLQVMWDFPLQAAWGQEIADNSPAIYTNANLEKFITAAVKAQAVFALDCRTSLAGALSIPIYDQLVAIKQ